MISGPKQWKVRRRAWHEIYKVYVDAAKVGGLRLAWPLLYDSIGVLFTNLSKQSDGEGPSSFIVDW